MIKCPACGMEFTNQDEHDEHHAKAHGKQELACSMCSYMASSKEDLEAHAKMHQENRM